MHQMLYKRQAEQQKKHRTAGGASGHQGAGGKAASLETASSTVADTGGAENEAEPVVRPYSKHHAMREVHGARLAAARTGRGDAAAGREANREASSASASDATEGATDSGTGGGGDGDDVLAATAAEGAEEDGSADSFSTAAAAAVGDE